MKERIARFWQRGSSQPEDKGAEPQEDTDFSYFKLVTIPQDTKNIAPTAFNDSVSRWVVESLSEDVMRKGGISSLEVYLTQNALDRLSDQIGLNNNFQNLLDTIRGRVSQLDGVREPDVSWNERGIPLTPALAELFDQCFIVRPVFPPQVYAPFDESKIASNVDQILIGMVRVEDATGTELGQTPVRALLIEGGSKEGTQRLQVHTDFDLLLKAFSEKRIAEYPLGLCIRCTLVTDDDLRRVSDITLDLHDTKALAAQAEAGEDVQLSYTLIEGGAQRTDIRNIPSETVRVPAEPESEPCWIAPRTHIPVNRKVGVEVTLRYKNLRTGRFEAEVYRYLFRFFKYAPRFVPSSNKLVATGQFIRASDETVVMLPPAMNSGVRESQTEVMTLTPAGGHLFTLTPAADSPVRLSMEGATITAGTSLSLADLVKIRGMIGHEGDGDYEEFTFNLLPLSLLSRERQAVAERKSGQYVGFVEISSKGALPDKRIILLSKREVKVGRGRLLHRSTPVSADALTLRRAYVVWEAEAKREDHIFYYSRQRGEVAQGVSELAGRVGLGLMGTYLIYIGDYEFTLSLEATQRTELNMMEIRERQGRD